MSRFGPYGRGLAAAALATGVSVAPAVIAAGPADSQVVPEENLTLTGVASCDLTGGTGQWVVTYTATNVIADPPISGPAQAAISGPAQAAISGPAQVIGIDIVITGAQLSSGAQALGDLVFTPNPLEQQQSGTVVVNLPGSFTGPLWLAVDYNVPALDGGGSQSVQLEIDSTCPPPTTTTAAPAVQAVQAAVVSPSFTG